ncbi:hypothetical protein D3C87_1889470 [compost metagenome]
MFGACFFDFRSVQPFRMAAKRTPDFILIHRGGFQAVFRQRRWNDGSRHVFGIRQEIALNETARQVAAKQRV